MVLDTYQKVIYSKPMPINKKKMQALKKEYGTIKGEDIYYAMENKEKHSKKKK